MKHRKPVIAAIAAMLLAAVMTLIGRSWGGWRVPLSRIEMAPVARPTPAAARVEADATNPAPARSRASGLVPMGRSGSTGTPGEPPARIPARAADGVPYWCFRSYLPGLPWMMSTHENNIGNTARSDKEQIWQGERSLRLDFRLMDMPGPGAQATAFQRNVLWQAIRADSFRGKRFVFRPSLRAERGGSITAFLRTWNNTGIGPMLATVGLPAASTPTVTWGTAWGSPRLVLEVPADAEIIYYGIVQVGEHPVWIDHVEISTDDLSGSPSRDTPRYTRLVDELPPLPINPNWVWDEPKNLDFEIVYPAEEDTATVELVDRRELPLRC